VATARSLFSVVMMSARRPGSVVLKICRSSSIVLGNKPTTGEAVMAMSLSFAAASGPVNAYAIDALSPLPWMHRLNIARPDAGRVMLNGDAPNPQLLPPVRRPIESTSMAAEAAAVVGSVTVMSIPFATAFAAVREIMLSVTSKGTMTRGTGFESIPGAPGFCTSIVSVLADCTSAGFNAVAQLVAEVQVVPRGVPLIRIVEAVAPLPATKFCPESASGNPSTAPAMTLDGRMTSITGSLVSAIVAAADFVGSARLVAITEIALGEGATGGAEYRPLASTEPHAAPAQPWPATALCTVHVTPEFGLPVTVAKNWKVLSVPADGEVNA
jgi:hypothetical protein